MRRVFEIAMGVTLGLLATCAVLILLVGEPLHAQPAPVKHRAGVSV